MEQMVALSDILRITKSMVEIPKSYRADMRVPARVFVSEAMMSDIVGDKSFWQMVNVATLPGIQMAALGMPDIHQGYGFPIGGVAATAIDEGGVISPGGIGYDINCGVRLLTLNYDRKYVQRRLERLAQALFDLVPSGIGRPGFLKLSDKELEHVLRDGAHYMLKQGYGTDSDIEHCEEEGRMQDADPDAISQHAKDRGRDQLGTLGSGNHFLEVQYIDEIFDEVVANAFGLQKDMVTVMVHCGSRGLGHQTCTDYVRVMMGKLKEWGIELPDRELACAPFKTPEGQKYFAAMAAACNFGWANRHLIGHRIREACTKALGEEVVVRTVYDVVHNTGKKERHIVDGKAKELIVHRKGATRAFPAGRPEVPAAYRAVGHPVLIPGTMGTSSYVLVGTQHGLENAFGSCCHGAGRVMSRQKARKMVRGVALRKDLEAQGVLIMTESIVGLAEEAPKAYKDVDAVIEVVAHAQLARPVARLKPLAVVKG